MKDQCFDEGTIQAFLDGELASEMLEQVARHIAMCDDCAMMLAETEEESAFAFAALDDQFNQLVPTERIRTSLYQAISEIEKPKVSFWERITNFSFIFSNPSLAAFAGLLIVVGLFAVIWKNNYQTVAPTTEVARTTIVNQTQPNNPVAQQNEPNDSSAPIQSVTVAQTESSSRPRIVNADYRPKYENATYKVGSSLPSIKRPVVQPASAEMIAGEGTYLKTIDTLKKTVDANKGMVLGTSARVAYEKDMAMVNDAITKMKTEVRKNPKNEVAREVLRNSYQNKIDLLNSVAEQSQMVAGLD